jgi:uncharacterized protein DUF397
MSHTAACDAADLRALTWAKSSYCGSSSANCLEAAVLGDEILVRDTKGPAARVLGFSRTPWSAFVKDLPDRS